LIAGNYRERRHAEEEIGNSPAVYNRYNSCFFYSADIDFSKKEHLTVLSAIPGVPGKRFCGLCMGSACLASLFCL
jgi:hypothetical protein